MYTKQPKKMLIMNILDIMKKYTDEDHRLSQREIMEILESEYDMKAERKSVKRNLMNLIDWGYNIEYSESVRVNKNGEEPEVFTVREEELSEWSAKYSPEPDVGKMMLTTYRDFQGYAISFDLTILTEPEELEELGEEVIYQ